MGVRKAGFHYISMRCKVPCSNVPVSSSVLPSVVPIIMWDIDFDVLSLPTLGNLTMEFVINLDDENMTSHNHILTTLLLKT